MKPHLLAYQLLQAGRFTEALPLAERAVGAATDCLPAHGMLATILLRLGRHADADRVVVDALALGTGVPDAYDALAHVSMLLGRHERSNELYRRVTEMAPTSPGAWYNVAASSRSLGRLEEAEGACNRAIDLDPNHYPSYLLRSELRVQSDTANHVDALRRLLSQRTDADRAQLFLGYALGKELDDLGRFEEAFQWFSTAAATRRRHLSYDVAVDEAKMRKIAAAFPVAGISTDHREPSANHIFIMGLPRSGTTLVERILTGLPNVRSNGETENFSRALLAAAARDSRDVFVRTAMADSGSVAAHYRLAAGGDNGEGVIEKLPMNYLYIGAMARALPDAKLLLVQRHPIDSCFAMFRTLFGEAYPFSYDLEDLARYYLAYRQLMQHWLAMLGNKIKVISYEELVANPVVVAKDVARFCDLHWLDSAIEIQRNAAASLTASAAQIRRPIYGSSSGKWQHYRPHLGPLIDAIGEHPYLR